MCIILQCNRMYMNKFINNQDNTNNYTEAAKWRPENLLLKKNFNLKLVTNMNLCLIIIK